jgi:cytoplasmic iron level regulating protein YaaA (DUF328/UPF0246 family)
MFQPRILVITSCTGEKRFHPDHQLVLEDFKDISRRQQREKELSDFVCPAGEMYRGLQHLRAMEAVQQLRKTLGQKQVDVIILSAGYGIISEHQLIGPYQVTFNTMKGHQVDEWARFLQIRDRFEDGINSYNLILVLLGDNYLRSLRLPVATQPHQTFIFLASNKSQSYIRGLAAKTFILTLSNASAKHYKYGLVGLKGFLLKLFAESITKAPELLQKVYETPELFDKLINSQPQQLELPLGVETVKIKKSKSPKSKEIEALEIDDEELGCRTGILPVSKFLPIPDLPPALNIHLGMKYFIPEWDDHVDPGYDFINDVLTPGRDTYKDEVYAHEIYHPSNYDGMLVSKVVVDSNKKKKAQINEFGIHKFIRFHGEVMGDCGAFGYIKEEVPPYTTAEILEYYEQADFNYGVSIDHLIVGIFAQPGIREKRSDITLKNAADFIKKHREGGYTFTPIGAAQGWSPETYAESVKALIEMGYDYIALGGIARAPNKEIIEILKAVCPYLKATTRLHIFGVARLSAIPVFRHLGVTSFDSASPLRRAWFGSRDNYHTMNGTTYAAIRIPSVNRHGVRTKRVVEAGITDYPTLGQLEKASLKTIRAFDKGESSLEETLEILLTYDEFLELPIDGKVDPIKVIKRRALHDKMYRKLLGEIPWKNCACPICEKLGVDVIIFRGNDRNRRRGFHNTYIFYQKFQTILNSLPPN